MSSKPLPRGEYCTMQLTLQSAILTLVRWRHSDCDTFSNLVRACVIHSRLYCLCRKRFSRSSAWIWKSTSELQMRRMRLNCEMGRLFFNGTGWKDVPWRMEFLSVLLRYKLEQSLLLSLYTRISRKLILCLS